MKKNNFRIVILFLISSIFLMFCIFKFRQKPKLDVIGIVRYSENDIYRDNYYIYLYVKNVGSRACVVPTANYGKLGQSSADSWSLILEWDFDEGINGEAVMQSPCYYMPVELQPGESIFFRFSETSLYKYLPEQIRITYAVEAKFAKRLGFWDGTLTTVAINYKDYKKDTDD